MCWAEVSPRARIDKMFPLFGCWMQLLWRKRCYQGLMEYVSLVCWKGRTRKAGRPGIFQALFESTAKVDGSTHITLQSITGMTQYEYLSFEELRLANYMSGNRGIGCIINGWIACCLKGGLKGAWAVCFRCGGCDLRMDGGQKVNYNPCSGVGSVRGYNLQPCSLCMGDGCQSCHWKGS